MASDANPLPWHKRPLEAFGETRTIGEWCRLNLLLESTVIDRLRRGWTPERAVGQGTSRPLSGDPRWRYSDLRRVEDDDGEEG